MKGDRRTAVVTGGAQGIGQAISRRLLETGHAVMIVDRDAEAGKEIEKDLSAAGPATFVAADVGTEDGVKGVADRVEDQFGNRLDVLVNNAGIMIEKPLRKRTLAEWNQVIAVNLTAAFLLSKYLAEALLDAKGAIVNIASTRALMSEPHTEAYAASKGGLVALTHALAISLGPDVRVNCISPGWIDVSGLKKASARKPASLSRSDHEQHPAGRVGKPEDVAALALFLADPANGFITGANYTIDGGMTRKMIYAE